MIPKLKPQVSSRSFPPHSIWSTSRECADEMSEGCRWAGGVLHAHGANAPASSLNRRACLLAQCAGRRAAPCAASPSRTACSRAGDPEFGGDPSLWHRGRCRHCRCRHPGSLECSFCSGSPRMAATQPLGRGGPRALARKVLGETSAKLFGERSIRKAFETLAKTPTQNSLFCKAKVLVSQFWDPSTVGTWGDIFLMSEVPL